MFWIYFQKAYMLHCPQFNVVKCHLIGDITMMLNQTEKSLRLSTSILWIHIDLCSNICIKTCFWPTSSNTHLHTWVQVKVLYTVCTVGQLLNKYILNQSLLVILLKPIGSCREVLLSSYVYSSGFLLSSAYHHCRNFQLSGKLHRPVSTISTC